ncbi:MAG: hypothetical protein DLM71_08580, partial [Chloroflexi bacterium]
MTAAITGAVDATLRSAHRAWVEIDHSALVDNLSALRRLAGGEKLVFPQLDNPLVSIVIPAYNKAYYTYQTVESLVATKAEVPLELVIVDNASADETRVLLAQFENGRYYVNEHNLGFGGACNIGAEMARGEFICFLNSDVVLTPGWLEALLRTIQSDPHCGAVGAKLVHPEGTLQEAGSIIWQDGSTYGY